MGPPVSTPRPPRSLALVSGGLGSHAQALKGDHDQRLTRVFDKPATAFRVRAARTKFGGHMLCGGPGLPHGRVCPDRISHSAPGLAAVGARKTAAQTMNSMRNLPLTVCWEPPRVARIRAQMRSGPHFCPCPSATNSPRALCSSDGWGKTLWGAGMLGWVKLDREQVRDMVKILAPGIVILGIVLLLLLRF